MDPFVITGLLTVALGAVAFLQGASRRKGTALSFAGGTVALLLVNLAVMLAGGGFRLPLLAIIGIGLAVAGSALAFNSAKGKSEAAEPTEAAE